MSQGLASHILAGRRIAAIRGDGLPSGPGEHLARVVRLPGVDAPVSVDGRWTRFALSRRRGHDPLYVCSACGSDEAAVDRYVNQLCEALIVAVVEAAEEHRAAEEYGGPWWSSSERFIKAVQGDLDELLRVQAMQREVIYRLSGYPLRTSLESPEFQD